MRAVPLAEIAPWPSSTRLTAVSRRAREGRWVAQIIRAGADVVIDGRMSPAGPTISTRMAVSAGSAARRSAVGRASTRSTNATGARFADPHAAATSAATRTVRLR